MSNETIDPVAFNIFEAAGWEKRVDAYHRFLGPITTRVIDSLLDGAEVGPERRVLDVATGPGYVAAAGAARGATAVGVDVAQEMVMLARRLHPEIEFRQADAERLPFDDAAFDAAVMNFGILHLGQPERAVGELARVVMPGGMVALSAWDAPERSRLMGIFVDAAHEVGAAPPAHIPRGPNFFRFSEDRELARLLADAGLSAVEVRTVPFTHRVSSADEWWDGVLSATVRTRALVLDQPEETQARIRAAFDRLAGRYTGDGTVEIPISVKLACGRKPRS